MEPLSRVDSNEDPNFAVRTALGVVLALLLAEPFGITMPMLPAALALSILSGQRGKFTIRRVVAPLAIPVLAYVFSYLAALTVGDPAVFTTVFLLLALVAFFLGVVRGSAGGTMLLLIPSLLSILAVASDQALIAMRDGLTGSALILALVVPVVNLLLPPVTERIHEPKPDPEGFANPMIEVCLRLAVFAPVLLLSYALGDPNVIIMPIVVGFVLLQGSHGMRWAEAVQRVAATCIGALAALVGILAYRIIPQLPMLLGFVALTTLFFTDRMMRGRLAPITYQFAASCTLVILISSLGTRDAIEIVIQRVVLTTLAASLAIGALALLEHLSQLTRRPSVDEERLRAVAKLE